MTPEEIKAAQMAAQYENMPLPPQMQQPLPPQAPLQQAAGAAPQQIQAQPLNPELVNQKKLLLEQMSGRGYRP